MFSTGIRIDDKKGVAEVLIYEHIGRKVNEETQTIEGISGADFAKDIMFIDSIPEVKRIDVRINSVGGYVFDGCSIFSALMNSKKVVHTYCDGIAASIAGIIYMAGKKRHIVDFGRVMIHDVQLANPVALLNEQQRNMLESTRESLLTILNNNSSVSESEMSEMMQKETWLNADEAIAKGLADKKIDTGRTFNESDTIETILQLSNSYTNEKITQKTNKMEIVINHLGLDSQATQKEVVESVKGIQSDLKKAENKVETLEGEITAGKEKVTALEAENSDLKTQLATSTVEAAINKGVFAEDQKAELIEQCKNDFAGFNKIVQAFKAPVAKVTNVISSKEEPKKSLREMERENPAELERIRNEEPETYKALYKSQYGVEPEM